MKKSKNTICRESAEARELYLCAINERHLYPMLLAIQHNLAKKVARGTYDEEAAVFAYTHVADEMAKIYTERFAECGAKWYRVFDVTARYTAASDILAWASDDINEEAKEMEARVKKIG